MTAPAAASLRVVAFRRTAPEPALDETPTPLDHWRSEQADLSAVERFAQRHEAATVPAQARWYRDLIPLSAPGPGQQYGFEVDLEACTGCKACVTSCHSLNGLDDGEAWRSVGLLHDAGDLATRQHVTAACHHCVDPACLNGCPVNAYDKDEVTGIVRHLDDQCIGCGYCTWTCPYEVPRMNRERGIVRKCDLCTGRLAEGEAPACVQGCPNAAIRVALVDVEVARRRAAEPGAVLVPNAPSSATTVPTTVYRSERGLAPELARADEGSVAPGHAHTPLVVMLVLTQLSVGAFLVDLALRLVGPAAAVDLLPSSAVVALVAGSVAIGASILHLGRPRWAFRAVLGVRRSWLSREIVAFGGFAGAAAAYAGAVVVGPGPSAPVAAGLAAVVAALGVFGVTSSVLIYAVTGRRWWRTSVTGPKFALTTVATGAAAVLATSLVSAATLGGSDAVAVAADIGLLLAATVVAATVAKLALEAAVLRHRGAGPSSELGGTALLLTRDLRRATGWRFGLGLAGGVAGPLLVAALLPGDGPGGPAVVAAVSLVALVAGELVERSQFFTAVTPPRMPGVPA